MLISLLFGWLSPGDYFLTSTWTLIKRSVGDECIEPCQLLHSTSAIFYRQLFASTVTALDFAMEKMKREVGDIYPPY